MCDHQIAIVIFISRHYYSCIINLLKMPMKFYTYTGLMYQFSKLWWTCAFRAMWWKCSKGDHFLQKKIAIKKKIEMIFFLQLIKYVMNCLNTSPVVWLSMLKIYSFLNMYMIFCLYERWSKFQIIAICVHYFMVYF
jgi:hypothetical protein